MDDSVRQEMEEMRSEMKAELLNAWAEVEQLQDEREEVVERNLELVCELEASRQREQELRLQLSQLQAQIGDSSQEQQQISPKGLRSLLRRGTSATSLCSVATTKSCSSRDLNDSDSSGHEEQPEGRWPWHKRRSSITEEEKERIEAEFIEQVTEMEREKQQLIYKWESRLKSREAILEELEKTNQVQDETLQQLRMELKIQDEVARQQEQDYKQHVHDLKKKLIEKKKYIYKEEKCYTAIVTNEN